MRLTKIYTRTGDQGKTRLADGSEVSKHSAIIHATGEVDELNSMIGVIITLKPDKLIADSLSAIQHHLFDLGAQIASAGQIRNRISKGMVQDLEKQIDSLNGELPPLEEFILPGGTPVAANMHLARTICRRAERSIIAINQEQGPGAEALCYINRLSDLLFVMARHENQINGSHEIYWKNPRRK